MTSEIALLNRSAIALAADSAMTASYWDKGKIETRYFKGTNKIFQLSTIHPVGIMIYAAAHLQGAPWDVLIKSYREQLDSKSHDDLPSYGLDFFDYIPANTHIFTAEVQDNQFKSDVDAAAARIILPIISSDDFKNAASDADKLTVSNAKLTETKAAIENDVFVGNATQQDVESALSRYSAEMEGVIRADQFFSSISNTVDLSLLPKIAITAVYKKNHTSLSNSGIVVAGFGEKDYFPRLVAYRCYGIVLGKLLWEEEQSKTVRISQSNSAAIVPFAQDEMIRTFVYGAGVDALVELDRQLMMAIESFCDELSNNGLIHDMTGDAQKAERIGAIKEATKQKFSDGIMQYFIGSHSTPLRRVLGMLPFDELAELAETLISIESLKERVTRPSASVGGPIDVAVVSKNDGFIWIKRKHYFDPKLNPRYFARRGMVGGS